MSNTQLQAFTSLREAFYKLSTNLLNAVLCKLTYVCTVQQKSEFYALSEKNQKNDLGFKMIFSKNSVKYPLNF